MSGNTKKKRRISQRRCKKLYWDTCVFLAWIKDESVWPDDVRKGIEQTIEMAIAGEVLIVTSALTMAEILESKMTPEQKNRFAGVFAAPYLRLVDLDRKISTRSSEIRAYHDTRKYNGDGTLKSGSFMRMPDAIHLATAIHMKVDAVHTLDGAAKNPKRLDMLELDGNVGGSPLAIRRPAFIPAPQFSATPIEPVSGPQRNLFSELEIADVTITQQKTEPVAVDVRSSGDGHPENSAGAEAAGGEGEDKKGTGDEAEGAITEGLRETGSPETAGEAIETAASPSSPPPSVDHGEQSTPEGSETKTSEAPPPSVPASIVQEPENETPASAEPAGDQSIEGAPGAAPAAMPAPTAQNVSAKEQTNNE